MSSLIPLTNTDEGAQAVMGRDLYEFLEVKARYNDWFNNMLQYGFVAGQDFYSISSKTSTAGGRPRTDHVLTLDMAKELSMIQRTPRGKQAREYFIECEKRAKSTPRELTRRDILTMALEAEERAELEAARADQAERRALMEGDFRRAVEAGDGITISDFGKKYFSQTPERTFFNHLYDHGWLIDQRGTRADKNGKKKNGPDHRKPTFKGRQYLYLHDMGVHGGKRRLRTRIRPQTEVLFRDALTGEGLAVNAHSTGLVLITNEQMRELA